MRAAAIPAILISMPLVQSEKESQIYSSSISRLNDSKQYAMSFASTVSQYMEAVMGTLVSTVLENPRTNRWEANSEEEHAQVGEYSEPEIRAILGHWRDVIKSGQENDEFDDVKRIDCKDLLENAKESSISKEVIDVKKGIAATTFQPESSKDEPQVAYAPTMVRYQVQLISKREFDPTAYDSRPPLTNGLRQGHP